MSQLQDRPYPQDVEAERALLGALLTSPAKIRDMIQLGVTADDFYRHDHGHLYTLLCDRWRAGESIDLVLVCGQIVQKGDADRYGGIGYVSQLSDYTPSPEAAPAYGRTIMDRAARRQLIDVGRQTIAAAHSDTPPQQIAAQVSEGLRGLRRTGHLEATTLGDSFRRYLDNAETAQNSGSTGVVQTGYRDLDPLLGGGLYPSELTILAARPAMGKSALLLNMLVRAARGGVPSGFFSLEMGETQLMDRFVAMWTATPLDLVRNKARWNETYQNPGEDGRAPTVWERVLEADGVLPALPIHIDYRPALPVPEVAAQATRWHTDHGIRLLGVDYLQLMEGEDRKANREQQVSSISRGLKAIAKDLTIPVVALAQLNRGVEMRKDKRPMVSDLRESGAIEQDADVIAFLYRDYYYRPKKADPRGAEVIVAKQRQGRAKTIHLEWQGRFQLFRDA